MRYRRAYVKGASYFFTVNLAERNLHLLTEHIGLLRDSFRMVMAAHPFIIDAIVILPNHLHTIWTLPVDDSDFSTRWGLIKAGFSRRLPTSECVSKSRLSKGECGIWQRRFWEHLIIDDADYQCHVDYIHYNPVKHGFVINVLDWPYSSFHRYVSSGLLSIDWTGTKTVSKICNIETDME